MIEKFIAFEKSFLPTKHKIGVLNPQKGQTLESEIYQNSPTPILFALTFKVLFRMISKNFWTSLARKSLSRDL